MGSDDAWVAQVQAAAERAGEKMWHLPLPEEYRRNLDSEIADLRNISSGGGGGHAHRRALLEGVHRRRAVGAPRHRRNRAVVVRRRGDVEGRNGLRRAHAGGARVDVPQAVTVRRAGRRRARRAGCSSARPRAGRRRSRRPFPRRTPVDLRGQDPRRDRRPAQPVHAGVGHRRRRHHGHVDEQRSGRAQRARSRPTSPTSAPRSAPTCFNPGDTYSFTFKKAARSSTRARSTPSCRARWRSSRSSDSRRQCSG